MIDCRNWCRISITCWIHKWPTIPHPNGWAMGCLLWILWEKIDRVITPLHCIYIWPQTEQQHRHVRFDLTLCKLSVKRILCFWPLEKKSCFPCDPNKFHFNLLALSLLCPVMMWIMLPWKLYNKYGEIFHLWSTINKIIQLIQLH